MEVDNAARGYLLASDEQYLPAYELARREVVEDMRAIEDAVANGQYEQPETRDLSPGASGGWARSCRRKRQF